MAFCLQAYTYIHTYIRSFICEYLSRGGGLVTSHGHLCAGIHIHTYIHTYIHSFICEYLSRGGGLVTSHGPFEVKTRVEEIHKLRKQDSDSGNFLHLYACIYVCGCRVKTKVEKIHKLKKQDSDSGCFFTFVCVYICMWLQSQNQSREGTHKLRKQDSDSGNFFLRLSVRILCVCGVKTSLRLEALRKHSCVCVCVCVCNLR
jgi:hypothetical protein